MQHHTKRLIAALLMVAAAGIAPSNNLEALPQDGWYVTYYSDDTYGEIVGWEERLCSGALYREGQQTSYFSEERWECGGSMQTCQRWHCYTYGYPSQTTCVETTCPY
jgi:hypothetical protein